MDIFSIADVGERFHQFKKKSIHTKVLVLHMDRSSASHASRKEENRKNYPASLMLNQSGTGRRSIFSFQKELDGLSSIKRLLHDRHRHATADTSLNLISSQIFYYATNTLCILQLIIRTTTVLLAMMHPPS